MFFAGPCGSNGMDLEGEEGAGQLAVAGERGRRVRTQKPSERSFNLLFVVFCSLFSINNNSKQSNCFALGFGGLGMCLERLDWLIGT